MTEDQFKALGKQLDTLLAPLKSIAILQLAREFYSRAELRKLIAEHRRLEAASKEIYAFSEQVRKDIDSPGLTYEQRVAQFGDDKAARQMRPYMAALDKSKEANAAYDAFRREHRLVARLVDSASSLGKGNYE